MATATVEKTKTSITKTSAPKAAAEKKGFKPVPASKEKAVDAKLGARIWAAWKQHYPTLGIDGKTAEADVRGSILSVCDWGYLPEAQRTDAMFKYKCVRAARKLEVTTSGVGFKGFETGKADHWGDRLIKAGFVLRVDKADGMLRLAKLKGSVATPTKEKVATVKPKSGSSKKAPVTPPAPKVQSTVTVTKMSTDELAAYNAAHPAPPER